MNEPSDISEFEVALANGEAWTPANADPSADFLDDLREAGLEIPSNKEGAVLAIIDRFADEQGDRRAAEALVIVRERLAGSKWGKVLDAALFGSERSLRELGQETKKPHVWVWRTMQRLRGKVIELKQGAP